MSTGVNTGQRMGREFEVQRSGTVRIGLYFPAKF